MDDEKKTVDNAVPKSTAYKTKWSCKVFEEWTQNRSVKSCTLKPGGPFTTNDFEEGVQTLDTAITDMSACSLNCWLSMFVQSKRFFWGVLSFPFVVVNYLRIEGPPF